MMIIQLVKENKQAKAKDKKPTDPTIPSQPANDNNKVDMFKSTDTTLKENETR